MPSPLDARRLVEESVPAGVALVFWSLLAAVPRDWIALGLRLAGVVMALSYVVVRAVAIADSLSDDGQPVDPGPVLRENVPVALAAGGWFLAAIISGVFSGLLASLLQVPWFREIFDALSFALAATGVLTVVFYAVAVGTIRLRGQSESTSQPVAE
ncbi:hypothetical protein [Halorientalis salina]|uniref:hypothetical protein n=1 Tax=Halorientalis salina TaxID=2932266 RepID=UPI0010ACB869|nr:hypothetical protein [Halorientalis salina]